MRNWQEDWDKIYVTERTSMYMDFYVPALRHWMTAYRELEAQAAAMREVLEATEKIFFQITECENKGNGHCRYCQVEEYPVDEHGQRIYTQNVEHAVEWHFDHEEWCPSRIIDENRKDLSSTAGEALLDRLQKAEAVVEVAKDTCEELWGHRLIAIEALQKALDDLEGGGA